jgi:glycosyltransferase involved in cell wall biosynthesis
MPPLEAMTMNCPVVASNQAPMPEIIGDAALFFDWKDSQSLTQCLEDVTDDVVARNLIMKGTQRAKHYSWDRCAQQTLAAYRRLVS